MAGAQGVSGHLKCDSCGTSIPRTGHAQKYCPDCTRFYSRLWISRPGNRDKARTWAREYQRRQASKNGCAR